MNCIYHFVCVFILETSPIRFCTVDGSYFMRLCSHQAKRRNKLFKIESIHQVTYRVDIFVITWLGGWRPSVAEARATEGL